MPDHRHRLRTLLPPTRRWRLSSCLTQTTSSASSFFGWRVFLLLTGGAVMVHKECIERHEAPRKEQKMTREQVSKAIQSKSKVSDWLGEEFGFVTGWASADEVYVVWDGDENSSTVAWDEINQA